MAGISMTSDDLPTLCEESLPESNKREEEEEEEKEEEEEEDAPVLESESEAEGTDSDGDDEDFYGRSAERNRFGYRWPPPPWLAPRSWRFAGNPRYSRCLYGDDRFAGNHYYSRCLYGDDRFAGNPYYSRCLYGDDRFAGNPYYSRCLDRDDKFAGNPYYSRCLDRDDKPTAIVGAGLENLGNTCFLNAVMQCFLHTVPFLHGILSDKHSNCDKESFCLICAVRLLINHSLTRRNGPVSPLGLVNNLSYFSSGFKRFQQEDAHEFLQCFLDRLESCHVSSHSNNMVKQIFGGRLVSKLKCCSCGHCSDTYEPLIDLSLEIEDADNLLTALQSFTKVEIIEDLDTKFTCEECKEQVSIEKKLSFDQAPTVALFQLKRFKSDGCFVNKIDKHVEFPLDLDLQPFMLGGNDIGMELKYVLHAVVVHVGLTPTSGHYYCFIRLSPGMWCKFDDSRVVPVTENYVLSQEAYILYYAKEDTTWFSNFVETQEYFSLDSKAVDTPKSVLDKVHTSPPSPSSDKKSSRDCYEVSCDVGSELREDDNNNETTDGVQMHDNLETNEKIDDNPHGTTTLEAQPCAGPSLDIPSPNAPKEVSSTFCEKLNRPSEEGGGAANNQINPSENCPRSPSPEIYREDPTDAGIMIPRDHLKTVACKRHLEKDMDDAETKQAYSLIRRRMPGLRGQQMMAALMGSKFKAPANPEKSRKLGKGDSSIRPVVRPLMAEIHR